MGLKSDTLEEIFEKMKKNQFKKLILSFNLSALKNEESSILTEIKSRRNFFGFFNHSKIEETTSFFY